MDAGNAASYLRERRVGADAHALFAAAANDLRQSDWFVQVGWRAKRDCAMLEVGVWCNATGDGSDIL